MGEFWTMVWQEGVETMVCFVMDQELGQAVYIPRDKDTITVEGFTISVKSTKSCNNYLERVINITNSSSKQTRAVMAVQMVGWPGPDLPLSPACLLDAAEEGCCQGQAVPQACVRVLALLYAGHLDEAGNTQHWLYVCTGRKEDTQQAPQSGLCRSVRCNSQ